MNRNWKPELIGGVTTFFTMAYIVVVNPAILSTPGTGIPFSGALTATVLLAFTMTLLMGVYAKLPFAVAPGMGINAFFTFHIILAEQIPWPTALGMVFWAGVFFLLVSVTRLRETIVRAIPDGLRIGAAVGIGIFLTFIGLKGMGLVVAHPVTLVKMGRLGIEPMLSLLGLALIVILVRRKNPLAFLIAIFLVTTIAALLGNVSLPVSLFSPPDFESVFLKMDIWGALRLSYLPAIISLMMTDLFDSLSTFIGVSEATGLVDEKGEPPRLKQGLLVDSFATLFAGLFGTSSGTAYIESTAGIEAGGRTGLASVFTALCFLPCFFLAPLAGAVPAFATAPVLVYVGALMFRTVTRIKVDAPEDLIPIFLTIVLIPLTFSITQGILWGFISHIVLYVLVGRARHVSLALYLIGAASAGLLFIEHIS